MKEDLLTVKQMITMAQVLGYAEDYAYFTEVAEKLLPQFQATFYNQANNTYLTGGQTEMVCDEMR